MRVERVRLLSCQRLRSFTHVPLNPGGTVNMGWGYRLDKVKRHRGVEDIRGGFAGHTLRAGQFSSTIPTIIYQFYCTVLHLLCLLFCHTALIGLSCYNECRKKATVSHTEWPSTSLEVLVSLLVTDTRSGKHATIIT